MLARLKIELAGATWLTSIREIELGGVINKYAFSIVF